MTRSSVCLLALVTAIFASAANADGPVAETQIKELDAELVKKKDWKNAGFETPQATAQTFLWATREGDIDVLLKCFGGGALPQFTDADKKRMKEAANAALSYKPLAIKSKGARQVELKFTVEGWQERPFVHQLTLIGHEWKIDPSSCTRTADW